MKRILSLLLAVLLLSCTLVSCDRDGGGNGGVDPQHVHIFEKASCKSPKTCECGATEGKPLNKHNFEDGVCVDCEKKLIIELARIVTDPGMEKPKDGFAISRDDDGKVKYIRMRSRIVDKTLELEDIDAFVDIKLDQEGITTGVYDWAITLVNPDNDKEAYYLYGTLNAADFFDVTTLTVTENRGFPEADISKYIVYIPTCVDRMMNQNLIPVLQDNPSGIKVDDLGFVNYAEVATTK